ncbi:MAG: OmpH family outer membrane protein [Flavobacteriales bacterium]|nr:OmpH family outer membrane protein [Flavobacteriales bacterium]MCB9193074.1 OmpH family outer membrane protein [Flavobacteriales bacterium]
MRSFLLRIVLLAAPFLANPAHAQRIAFVDTKYILDQMPDYHAAQDELDHFSSQWQKEIEERYDVIKRLRDAYNAEAILLTEEMKKSRLADIESKEQEARELQKKRFGVNGDLFKKRQELIQPIQDRVFQAVKEVAGTSYLAIFDIGSQGNNILFANDKYDKSDSVLRKLGIRPDHSNNPGNMRDGEDEDNDQGDEPDGNDRMNSKDRPNTMDKGGKPQTGQDNTVKPR